MLYLLDVGDGHASCVLPGLFASVLLPMVGCTSSGFRVVINP